MITSCGDKRDECKRTADEASKTGYRFPKPGSSPCPGNSMEGTYLLATRGPVFRRHDSYPGFRTELESLGGDDKGKSTSGRTTRLKVPMHQPESHCSIIARKRSNVRRAKGAGHPRQEGVNGQPEELLPWRKPGGASSGWHEPDESRDSRPDLWETRGEIPRVYPAYWATGIPTAIIRGACPVPPVVISGGGAGDQSVGSPGVKVLVGWVKTWSAPTRRASNSTGRSASEP